MRAIFRWCILGLPLLGLAASPFAWQTQVAPEELQITVEVAPRAALNWESLEFELADGSGREPQRIAAPVPVTGIAPDGARELVLPAGRWTWRYRGSPPFQVKVAYQGCINQEDGTALCLLPQTETLLPAAESPFARQEAAADLLPLALANFRLERSVSGTLDEAEFLKFLDVRPSAAAEPVPPPPAAWWMLLLALGGGLLLNFTPCVLPMIPVNLAIIGAGSADRRTGLWRGLAYGAGEAAAYGILGCAVILGGARFGSLNGNPSFNFALAAVFAVLALATAGVVNLDLSRWLKLKPSRLKGGALVAAFLLGGAAALLAGACVAPVVLSVLLFALERYQSGEVYALGLPFLLGVGMALPWPLAGAGLAALPKPGRFMLVIKYAFAAVIAAAAVYYGVTGYRLLRYDAAAEFAKLDAALAQSAAERRPLLLKLGANWCKNCKAMERGVLNRPQVKARLKDFVVCRFQAEQLNAPGVRELMEKLRLAGLPGFAILTPPGR